MHKFFFFVVSALLVQCWTPSLAYFPASSMLGSGEYKETAEISRIAFGSCNKIDLPQPLWKVESLPLFLIIYFLRYLVLHVSRTNWEAHIEFPTTVMDLAWRCCVSSVIFSSRLTRRYNDKKILPAIFLPSALSKMEENYVTQRDLRPQYVELRKRTPVVGVWGNPSSLKLSSISYDHDHNEMSSAFLIFKMIMKM